MKKKSFLEGALIATFGIVLVKIIGLIYVIPFNAIIGEQGGALYGYGYNIYQLFLSISSAGFPFAISKMTSLARNQSVLLAFEGLANGEVKLVRFVFLYTNGAIGADDVNIPARIQNMIVLSNQGHPSALHS